MSDGGFRALVARKDGKTQSIAIEILTDADLPDGDVTVNVEYSSFNYKDGLALQPINRILRNHPIVPGIDFAGTVIGSRSSRFKAGDKVVLTGWGVGEGWSGGFAERARVRADWLVPLPSGMTARQAMAIGTAGLTAMLCVMALEQRGIRPGGDVLVTGAAAIVPRAEYQGAGKPLAAERWHGAVDTVGGTLLANVIAAMAYGGGVACCGLAGGTELPTTVFPFILRNVALLGIDSVQCPSILREQAWARLAAVLSAEDLALVSQTVGLDRLVGHATAILAGQVRGRTVVDVRG